MSTCSITGVVGLSVQEADASSREPLEDAQLLEAIAGGDEPSFEVLYRRYAETCRARARHVLQGHDWVQDVVQGVFIDVWLYAVRFDGARGSAHSWLMAMTHHKAVDVVRSQQRYNQRRTSEDRLSDRVDPASSPEDIVTAAETAERLREAVSQLRPPQRDALRLCYLAGLSQREAAARLDVPEGTVKTRSWRGVNALRGVLGPASQQP